MHYNSSEKSRTAWHVAGMNKKVRLYKTSRITWVHVYACLVRLPYFLRERTLWEKAKNRLEGEKSAV